MALCNLCSTVPFTSLPEPPKTSATTDVAGNPDMPVLRYGDIGAWGGVEVPKDPLGFMWHTDLDALAASADDCPLCEIVQAGVQAWLDHYEYAEHNQPSWVEFSKGSQPIPSRQRLWLTKRFGGAPGFIVLVRNPKKDTSVFLLTGVGFSSDDGIPWGKQVPLRPFQLDSGSTKSLDVAVSWVENCVDSHERCQRSEETVLPTRIIDVGESGDTVKLVDGGGVSGKYASLSYCWGQSDPFVTSRGSIEARRSGMHLSDLPRTFLDAVIIVRHLGIRYLWIDSLCICQDDNDDWARESARMIDVYSNAQLVIAVDHAKDKSEGCFNTRQARKTSKINIPGYTSEKVDALSLFPGGEYIWSNRSLENGPLMKRGWALQERLLARRILHYDTKQAYFECNHGIIGEDGCLYDRRNCDLDIVRNVEQSADSLPADGRVIWDGLLCEYGKRSLTRATDKLPAMSGLARLFQRRIGAKYVAGLWSDSLLEGMSFQSIGKREPASPDKYTGPSWSWAGYGGIAATLSATHGWTDIAEVQQWYVELKSEANPYGEVKDAWIRIRAPLAKLTPSEKEEDDHEARLKKVGITPAPRLCTPFCKKEEGSQVFLDHRDSTPLGAWRNWDMAVMVLGESSIKTKSKGDSGELEPHKASCFGLVIAAVEDRKSGKRKKRVGWMHMDEQEATKMRADEKYWDTVTLI